MNHDGGGEDPPPPCPLQLYSQARSTGAQIAITKKILKNSEKLLHPWSEEQWFLCYRNNLVASHGCIKQRTMNPYRRGPSAGQPAQMSILFLSLPALVAVATHSRPSPQILGGLSMFIVIHEKKRSLYVI